MEKKEKIFLKEQDLVEFKTLQGKIKQVIYSIGEVGVEKQLVKEKEIGVLEIFNKVRKEELNLMKKMERIYGSGTIDSESGEFIKTEPKSD